MKTFDQLLDEDRGIEIDNAIRSQIWPMEHPKGRDRFRDNRFTHDIYAYIWSQIRISINELMRNGLLLG